MKIQIRHGVFETNSSSTHSMTICDEKDYDKWAHGEESHLYFKEGWSTDSGDFLSKEEVEKEILENTEYNCLEGVLSEYDWYDSVEEMLNGRGYYKYEDYGGWQGYSMQRKYKEYYRADVDKNIVIFGTHGYNG